MGAHHISSGTKADRSTGCSLGCSTWPRGYIAGTGVGGHCHGDHSELDHLRLMMKTLNRGGLSTVASERRDVL